LILYHVRNGGQKWYYGGGHGKEGCFSESKVLKIIPKIGILIFGVFWGKNGS